jgi:chorismate mutase
MLSSQFTMTDQNDDPIIRRFREQISDNDRHLVEAINRRLELVARLKTYKESRGVDFLDPEREEWMLRYLSRANRGPLSAEGLREVYTELLDLTKREVARSEASPPPDSAAANQQSSPDTP